MSLPPPDELAAAVQARVSTASVIRTLEPLARRTTIRVGGPADCYVEPATEDDLGAVVRFCCEAGVPLFVLGRGSNLLVLDGGIRGVVICLSQPAFSRIELEGAFLRCGAGARLKVVAAEARRMGLGGLEFLEGIPATVGGALRMNAGAMGSWTFDVVESLRVMNRDGRIEEKRRPEVEVRYRECPLLRDQLALSVVFRGGVTSREQSERRSQEYNQRRWASQPAAPSAGCIFKNPAAVPAGRLIDELGFKGVRTGGARVSDVHANFIVNEGGATAADVLRLIGRIRSQAEAERGIWLETEVEIVGEALPSGDQDSVA